MILVGERLNGQFDDVGKAIQERNPTVLHEWAEKQAQAGSDYLDVSVGTAVASREKAEAMVWMVETIQEATEVPLAIDSPVDEVMKAGLQACDHAPMINSTNADPEVLDEYLDLALEHDAALIALTMDADGVPNDVAKRVELAGQIVMAAMEKGFPFDKLYVDVVAQPVRAVQAQPSIILEAIKQLQGISDPLPHFIIGLSNTSQGAVNRSLIDRTYLAMCMAVGLDAAILNVMDDKMIDVMIAAEVLLNNQIYNDSFLSAYRASKRG